MVEIRSANQGFASLSEIMCALEFMELLFQAEPASVGSLAPE